MARKILLADDSVTAQNMGRKILADAGYDVVTVNNGSAALKRIAEINPDLIVLDVYMPGYSGLEVCQRLKDAEETAHIPVLLTVGKLEPFKPEEARRVRADGHIVKPFEASELLTAITRLEDRMVPQQQAEVTRFGSEGGGRKSGNTAGGDTGWKSRLGFPSKKKKEEKEEPEDVMAAGGFRDFRKGKSKAGASGTFAVKGAAGQEPSPQPSAVPDIPRDITPEELDALSALAAKLDGAAPAHENIAPPSARTLATTPDTTLDTTQIKTGPVEAPAVEVAATKAAADAKEDAKEKEEEKTGVETTAPAVETAAVAVEASASAVEGAGEVQIPVEHVEVAAQGAASVGVADPVALETPQRGTEQAAEQHSVAQNSENQNSEAAVSGALLTQEAAPVDRNDEPVFSSAASVVEQAAEEKADAKLADAIVIAVPKSETNEAGTLGATAAGALESKPEPSKTQDSSAGELQVETSAQPVPVAAKVNEIAAAEGGAPSDEELAQALCLLTPATAHAETATVPLYGSMVAAGSRWVAEPVALSREEAAVSLEAEMFRILAVMPATMPGGEIEPVRITGVSAITAAVENRLAAIGLAAGASTFSEPRAEHSSASHSSAGHGSGGNGSAGNGSEAISVEASAVKSLAVESSAEATAAVSNAASPVVHGNETAKIAAENLEAERKHSPAEVPEEAPAAATFADMVGQSTVGQDQVGQDNVDATAEQNGESVCGTAGAVAPVVAEGEHQDSSSHIESEESMRKDAKSKSEKSNGHQVQTGAASAAASNDAAETAEAPKAMAATAAAEGSSSSSSDASAIASIVDSVMADLRPKIVEEIAKRLAGK